MRLSAVGPVCVLATTMLMASAATTPTLPTPAPAIPAPTPHPHASKLFRSHSIVSDIDSRVLAALLASTADSDFDITVRTGEPALCDSRTCSVPVTIKLPDNAPPMRLAVAVSNAKGEISEVKHADCATAHCSVQLVLERGHNTIAVGAANALTQSAGVAITKVDAQPVVSMMRGRTEWF